MDEATADRMLTFEQKWWVQRGAKEVAIVEQFGCSPTIYYLRLVHLVSDPPAPLAVKHAPTIARLRRGMERQARMRRAS